MQHAMQYDFLLSDDLTNYEEITKRFDEIQQFIHCASNPLESASLVLNSLVNETICTPFRIFRQAERYYKWYLAPMNKKEKAAFISKILDREFAHPEIPLKHKDEYTLLIAVLLSAQCTDARVNLVTPKLFALADTPKKMAALDPAQIEEIIQPCGLFKTKAKAIWNLSKDLIERHHSLVPKSFDELEALPGVGHKTASVVMAQAFHNPAFPVDTHIHRCARRWGLSPAKTVEQTERDLKKCFPKSSWIKVHLQIIYFARKFCPARGHDQEACPICKVLGCKVLGCKVLGCKVLGCKEL
jgi:endonuclease-3